MKSYRFVYYLLVFQLLIFPSFLPFIFSSFRPEFVFSIWWWDLKNFTLIGLQKLCIVLRAEL